MSRRELMRDFSDIRNLRFDDENFGTATSLEQQNVEHTVENAFRKFSESLEMHSEMRFLLREEHLRFLQSSLRQLPEGYECLDSSRPWLVFWLLNAAHLLGHTFRDEEYEDIITFLERCRSPCGGFAGGPQQHPHLAPTYAAVNALAIVGTPRAYDAIDRDSLHRFLYLVKDSSGGFCMHLGGEMDVRGAYCAIAVASLTNIQDDKLFEGTANWVISCQTYEGGFGGAPNLEAHGGYSFCGAAALVLLGNQSSCNLNNLLRWTVGKQMKLEGGFQGRTNKLVDGCYSFWQGATVPVIQALIHMEKLQHCKRHARGVKIDQDSTKENTAASSYNNTSSNDRGDFSPCNGCMLTPQKEVLFDRAALQEYVLIACQLPKGGLVDKPGKPRDLYHTCYTLSGLSIAQHGGEGAPLCVGGSQTLLDTTHILYNVPPMAVSKVQAYFQAMDQLGVSKENDIFKEHCDANLENDVADEDDSNYIDEEISVEYM